MGIQGKHEKKNEKKNLRRAKKFEVRQETKGGAGYVYWVDCLVVMINGHTCE